MYIEIQPSGWTMLHSSHDHSLSTSAVETDWSLWLVFNSFVSQKDSVLSAYHSCRSCWFLNKLRYFNYGRHVLTLTHHLENERRIFFHSITDVIDRRRSYAPSCGQNTQLQMDRSVAASAISAPWPRQVTWWQYGQQCYSCHHTHQKTVHLLWWYLLQNMRWNLFEFIVHMFVFFCASLTHNCSYFLLDL